MRLEKTSVLAVVALLVSLGAASGVRAMAQSPDPNATFDDHTQPSPEEEQILELTNEVRNVQGLGPLHWNAALATGAAQHNQWMRGQPELSHQYPGEDTLLTRASRAGAHFAAIAENIAVGPSPGAVEREWLHSAPHRANILDPRMDAIGIAVVRRGGDLYATEDFAQSVTSVSPMQAEAQIAAMLRQRGMNVSTDANVIRDARETCEMNQGSAGGTQPHFIVRWESPTLDQLPAPLTERMATGRYTSAAVGACTSMHPQQGFTSYHLAVLLF